jgi:hypothetical protein
MSPDKNQKDNPIQKEYDDKLNPLKNIEKKGTIASGKGSGQKNGIANNLGISGVKDAEQSAGGAGWKNNVMGAAGATAGLKSQGMKAALKKKSPTLAIIALVIGLMTGVAMFGGAALLPQSLLANLVQKFNSHQETSLTIRTNKLLAVKLADNVTHGSCSYVKIACRFKRPSNKLLAQLEKNGIEALNKNGEKIESKTLFPNEKPAKYRFTNSIGEGIEVGPKEISSAIAKNSEFRDAMHQATKTRFMSLSDYVAKGVKARFGINYADKAKSVSDEKSLTAEADELSAATDETAEALDGESDNALKAYLKNMLGEYGDELAQKLSKSSKGDAIGFGAGLICIASDAPGLLIKANRSFQMAQLIKYSMVFLSAFGAIKAGDGTSTEAAAIGAALTAVVKGKSAMDSGGIIYATTGALPSNNKYKKYSPGSNIIESMGGVNKVLGSRTKKDICNIAANPATGAAIDAGLAAAAPETLGLSLVALGINAALGYGISVVIGYAVPPLIKAAVDRLPVDKIMKYFLGDLTQNLEGEPVGDAITSGAAHVMGQTSNAGGNMPLTVKQAVAYDNLTNQVQLAYAEEDRATKSPLDASSPNTFMGSLISKLTPYYMGTGLGSGFMSNSMASIGKMITGSFSMVLQPVTASAASQNPSDEYKLCEDPEITDNDIAAGPFCNIIYGIPNKYLDKEPDDIVDSLVASGDIDEETGNAKDDSDYANWLANCTDGTTENARNCTLNDDQNAEYAVYTIDHRIQISIDEEEVDSATVDSIAGGSSSDTDSSSDSDQPVGDGETPANVKSSGKGWTLKDGVDYSNVQCASGTTDEGVYKHPTRKFKVRLCNTALGEVASIISLKIKDMVDDAKKDEVTLTGSSFRSYETQQKLYAENCSSGYCNPPTAAPGNSNHERGIATDFSNISRGNPVWNWLAKNAKKYGYYNLPSETWHWSVDGG